MRLRKWGRGGGQNDAREYPKPFHPHTPKQPHQDQDPGRQNSETRTRQPNPSRGGGATPLLTKLDQDPESLPPPLSPHKEAHDVITCLAPQSARDAPTRSSQSPHNSTEQKRCRSRPPRMQDFPPAEPQGPRQNSPEVPIDASHRVSPQDKAQQQRPSKPISDTP